jgi:hypothetical protein
MKRLFPILSVLTALMLAYALYQALVVAPADAQQGDVYRIIYYHVPSAWTAFLLFFINFIASIQYLVSAKPSTQKAAKWIVIAIGVIGVIACFLLHDCAGDGADLGEAGVGHLVGAGRHSPDVDAGAVADLRELPGAAEIFQ